MAPLQQADSIESGANLSAESFNEERHIARAEPSARGGQTSGQTRSVKAVSRRSRARVARALTGVGWSGSASLGNAKHIVLTS
jgi:esterase/lipase superfamily enzyme